MGLDARWYCYTCVSVDEPESLGGRDCDEYTGHHLKADELLGFVKLGRLLMDKSADGWHARLDWLEELGHWLQKHEAHDIWIANDAVTGAAERLADLEYDNFTYAPPHHEGINANEAPNSPVSSPGDLGVI